MKTLICTLIVFSVSFAFAGSPAENLYYSKCAQCHSGTVALKEKKSKSDWIDTINRMTRHGLDITNKQTDAIATFLAGRK